MTSVEIPSSVTYIGSWAFQECSGLINLVIPSSVISIGGFDVDYDDKQIIIYGGTKKEWKAIEIGHCSSNAFDIVKIYCTDGILNLSGYEICE